MDKSIKNELSYLHTTKEEEGIERAQPPNSCQQPYFRVTMVNKLLQ